VAFKPKFISFDCHGTLINFEMGPAARNLFMDRLTADRMHEMQMRNSTWSNLALTVRELSQDMAVAHLEWRIEGDRDADAGRREPRRGLFTWVLAMEGDRALIAAAHNTNVVSGPNPPRSPASAQRS